MSRGGEELGPGGRLPDSTGISARPPTRALSRSVHPAYEEQKALWCVYFADSWDVLTSRSHMPSSFRYQQGAAQAQTEAEDSRIGPSRRGEDGRRRWISGCQQAPDVPCVHRPVVRHVQQPRRKEPRGRVSARPRSMFVVAAASDGTTCVLLWRFYSQGGEEGSLSKSSLGKSEQSQLNTTADPGSTGNIQHPQHHLFIQGTHVHPPDFSLLVLDGFISDGSKEQERKNSTSLEEFHVRPLFPIDGWGHVGDALPHCVPCLLSG